MAQSKKSSTGANKHYSSPKVTFQPKKKVTFLNPAEKGKKAAKELKSGIRYTNDGAVKLDENGKKIKLTKAQKSYRAGYLTARKDNARAYRAKKNNYLKKSSS